MSDSAPKSVDRHARGTRQPRVQGLTLVEMLIAIVVTLIIIGALAQAFAVVSETISISRATIEMSGQLRGVARRIQLDLEGITVPVRPWPTASSGLGFFEYLEGPSRDNDTDADGTFDLVQYAADPTVDTSLGDIDDVVCFTARSTGEPFVGQIFGQLVGDDILIDRTDTTNWDPNLPDVTTITSNTAEIIWWTVLNSDGSVSLYRRVLLVRPDLNLANDPAIATLTYSQFFNAFDISAHPVGGGWIPNTLAELTKRENRFGHNPASYPFPIDRSLLAPKTNMVLTINGRNYASDELGEDIMVADVRAFDFRVFDPDAPVQRDPAASINASVEALIPGDPGYGALPAIVRAPFASKIGAGAFVDLNWAGHPVTFGDNRRTAFSGIPAFVDTNGNGLWDPAPNNPEPPYGVTTATYDTWSFDYEYDGINQDSAFGNTHWRGALTDQGTDGFDSDNTNGVDDAFERETAPPYPVPLRGAQVRIRIVDPDTRQVRQMTITTDFTPE